MRQAQDVRFTLRLGARVAVQFRWALDRMRCDVHARPRALDLLGRGHRRDRIGLAVRFQAQAGQLVPAIGLWTRLQCSRGRVQSVGIPCRAHGDRSGGNLLGTRIDARVAIRARDCVAQARVGVHRWHRRDLARRRQARLQHLTGRFEFVV